MILETHLVFDPVVNPELNPIKTDTLLSSDDAMKPKASKARKLWASTLRKKDNIKGATSSSRSSPPPQSAAAQTTAVDGDADAADAQPTVPDSNVASVVESEYVTASAAASEAGAESSKQRRRRSLGQWAAAFQTKKVKTAEEPLPSPLPAAESTVQVAPGALDQPKPDSAVDASTLPVVGTTEDQQVSCSRALQGERSDAKKPEKNSSAQTLRLKKVDGEGGAAIREAVVDAGAAEFRAKRGHHRLEVLMEKLVVAAEPVEAEVAVDSEEEAMQKRFGGDSSKATNLYILCKS